MSRADVVALRRLLKAGASPCTGDHDGRTAAHICATGKRETLDEVMLGILCQYGGSAVAAACDRYGSSPVDDATRCEFEPRMVNTGGDSSKIQGFPQQYQ